MNALIGWLAIGFIAVCVFFTGYGVYHSLPRVVAQLTDVEQ